MQRTASARSIHDNLAPEKFSCFRLLGPRMYPPVHQMAAEQKRTPPSKGQKVATAGAPAACSPYLLAGSTHASPNVCPQHKFTIYLHDEGACRWSLEAQ